MLWVRTVRIINCANRILTHRSKKKTATAVAFCKQGKGLIKVNGRPLSLVQPELLRFKVYEPVLILGPDKFGTENRCQLVLETPRCWAAHVGK